MFARLQARIDRTACALVDASGSDIAKKLGFETREITLDDGRIASYMHKPGKSERTPFVFLPGLSMEAKHVVSLFMPWIRVDGTFGAKGLPRDVPAYVIELPAHGLNASLEAPATLSEFASYVLAVLDQLELRGPIYLGGYSLGGALAVNIAALLEQASAGGASKRIEKIVLLAPALALTRSFHSRLNAPTVAERREQLRETHAYESPSECRAFFTQYCGLPTPRNASICYVKGVMPAIGLLVNLIFTLMLRAFSWGRRRDYPPDHFANLMEHVTRNALDRRIKATGCDVADATSWPDEPLKAMRNAVDPHLWKSLSAAFAGDALPTLLVVAEEDTVIDKDLLAGLAADGHLGKAVTVHVVKGAGHIFAPSQIATLLELAGPVIGKWLGV